MDNIGDSKAAELHFATPVVQDHGSEDFGLEENNSKGVAQQKASMVSTISEISSVTIEASSEPRYLFIDSTISSSHEMFFTLFPKLPIELRPKIWKEALPGPRIIEIFHQDIQYLERDECEGEPFDVQEPQWEKVHLLSKIKAKLPPPVLLSVSRESRQAALKVYSLKLDTVAKAGNYRIDPVHDILFFPFDAQVSDNREDILFSGLGLIGEVLGKIRHPAVDNNMLDLVLQNLFLLTGLQILTVVLHDICDDRWDNDWPEITFFEESKNKMEYIIAQYGNANNLIAKFKSDTTTSGPTFQFRCMTRGGVKCSCYEQFQ